jgi:threonine dehydrogenase-like Zn-dependent dehydrogenase
VIPDHEFAGVVAATGRAVTRFSVGDRVAVDPSLYCYGCHYCRIGRNNLCERWGAIGVTRAGAAAEYVAVPEANCVSVPPEMRLEDAVLIEPLSCAIHAYDVLSSQLGAHVLIYGSGTMGLITLELAKRVGVASVDMVDVNEAKLAFARRLGCSAAAAAADALNRPAYGWDLVIDATGNQQAIQDGLGRVAPGGAFLQFGVADYAARVTISPYEIYNKEITITGSMAVLHSYERAAELFGTGLLDPEVLITDRLPLASYPSALQRFAAGTGLKVQVNPSAVG